MIHFDQFAKLVGCKLYPDKKTSRGIAYINIEAALDIETTSIKVDEDKIGLPYIWMFGIGHVDAVFYGRYIEELPRFFTILQDALSLNDKRRFAIYVHNLQYEFQFIRKHLIWTDTFFIDERTPLRLLTSNHIELRDSYLLSGYSLDNLAKVYLKGKVQKAVGDLDYKKIRHPQTPLTEVEIGYCRSDINVLKEYVKGEIEREGTINDIPMTRTGRVRRYVRNRCINKNKNTSMGTMHRYLKLMSKLIMRDEDYVMLRRAFQGGFTHASTEHVGKTLKNVASLDIVSSYPAVMLTEQFPMGRGEDITINSELDIKQWSKTHCLVMLAEFETISSKIFYEDYLSESKCIDLKNSIVNNGRVRFATGLKTFITCIDYQILERVYEWQTMKVVKCIAFKKDYLPKPILDSILKVYTDKTQLKGVKGREIEYALSKEMLNSIYGMCVTDPVKDIHTYTDTFVCQKVNRLEALEKHNHSRNRFLFYAWGVWVTAYARKNLWAAILHLDEDYIYSDTDSVKILNYDQHKEYFDNQNRKIEAKFNTMCIYTMVDKELFHQETITGERKYLGFWEHEHTYDQFKTLGAKRYLTRIGEEYTLTVAGLSKRNGMDYLKRKYKTATNIFKGFNDRLYVPKSETGKMTHTYIDQDKWCEVTDYLGNTMEMVVKSGIHLEDVDFTINISDSYKQFIDDFCNGFIYTGMKGHRG